LDPQNQYRDYNDLVNGTILLHRLSVLSGAGSMGHDYLSGEMCFRRLFCLRRILSISNEYHFGLDVCSLAYLYDLVCSNDCAEEDNGRIYSWTRYLVSEILLELEDGRSF
jgi:hypothetical protein